MTEYDLLRVTWIDAMTSEGWQSIEYAQQRTIPVIESVGFCIQLNDTSLMLAQSVNIEHGICADVIQIPIEYIQSKANL